MVGTKINRITIINDLGVLITPAGRKKKFIIGRCDCGKEWRIAMTDVKNGRTKSCGCYLREITSIRTASHRLIKDPIYKIWGSIKNRCLHANRKDSKSYYDKGVTICNEWMNDFMCFYNWATINGYKSGMQIDRIDNNLGYNPENCRFVSARDNVNNRANTCFLEHDGQKLCLTEWARIKNIPSETLRRRIFTYKWDISRALGTNKRQYA